MLRNKNHEIEEDCIITNIHSCCKCKAGISLDDNGKACPLYEDYFCINDFPELCEDYYNDCKSCMENSNV